jgi:AraC-like DNA-binding protein
VDVLSDVIEVSRVGGGVLANVTARAPWGLDVPRQSAAAFHAVASGTMWLRVNGDPPRRLAAGDVALFPTGTLHEIGSAPDGPVHPFDGVRKEELTDADGTLSLGGSGACTRFICAGYDYDHDVARRLLALLPPVVLVRSDGPGGEPVQATLRLLEVELDRRSPGSQPVVARLIDVLFVHIVRAWTRQHDAEAASWLRGLRDPTVAAALELLHARPAEPWTIESLARAVNVSRSTLARRFSELVGEPPLAYLTRWRMDLAARRLRESADSIEEIALAVGYSSEHTFSRAFLRHRGVRPGRYRECSAGHPDRVLMGSRASCPP